MPRPVKDMFRERENEEEEKRREESVTGFLRIPLHIRIWAYGTMPHVHKDCVIMLHANYTITQHMVSVGSEAPWLATEPHMCGHTAWGVAANSNIHAQFIFIFKN